MPWKGVTVMEQRIRFLKDYRKGYYSVTDLAERFSISRKTANKWIARYKRYGEEGYGELTRRPHSCPHQTPIEITEALLKVREAHPHWGPKKMLAVVGRRHRYWQLPAVATVARMLQRNELIAPRRRYRRAHPGCPKYQAAGPNEIWAADYKGQFRLKNGAYCFPLTVSDLYSRFLLGCDAHPCISETRTLQYFSYLFHTYGLPKRIRTDNGVPFASNALARLSKASVWWVKLGIYPELIEPGRPQQNGIHERIHWTLKQETTLPPEANLEAQQHRFDLFREEYNTERPHESLQMDSPVDLYKPSCDLYPSKIEPYDYPGNYLVRRVSRCGAIRVFKKQIFLSQTLNEEYVGLEEVDNGIYDVFFCFYHIGRYDFPNNRVEGIISRVPVSRTLAEAPKTVSPMY
jgi:transposase InsO family protein